MRDLQNSGKKCEHDYTDFRIFRIFRDLQNSGKKAGPRQSRNQHIDLKDVFYNIWAVQRQQFVNYCFFIFFEIF